MVVNTLTYSFHEADRNQTATRRLKNYDSIFVVVIVLFLFHVITTLLRLAGKWWTNRCVIRFDDAYIVCVIVYID